MTWKRLIFFSVLVGFLWLGWSSALAQEVPVSTTDVVYETESLSAELRRLKTQYRGELEEYRRLENTYQVAKQQYQQLGTLASLEDAVRATQAAMESRARVFKTYLQILKVSLLQQTGVEIDQKQATVTELDQALAQLNQHHAQFNQELDRVALRNIGADFKNLSKELNKVSYHTLSLFAIGELQTIFDRAALLTTDMESQLATQGGALKRAQRQRSFDETNRQLEVIKPELAQEHARIRDPKSSSYENVYHLSGKELRDVHADLAKVLGFLKELLKT